MTFANHVVTQATTRVSFERPRHVSPVVSLTSPCFAVGLHLSRLLPRRLNAPLPRTPLPSDPPALPPDRSAAAPRGRSSDATRGRHAPTLRPRAAPGHRESCTRLLSTTRRLTPRRAASPQMGQERRQVERGAPPVTARLLGLGNEEAPRRADEVGGPLQALEVDRAGRRGQLHLDGPPLTVELQHQIELVLIARAEVVRVERAAPRGSPDSC